MRQRLLLGPVLIAMIVVGLWIDSVLDRTAWPGFLRAVLGRETFPPNMVALPVVSLLSVLAGRELAAILTNIGVQSSKRMNSIAAVAGLAVTGFVPAGMDGLTATALIATTTIALLVGSMLYFSRNRHTEGVVASAGGVLLAFAYIGLMFGFLIAIRREWSAWVVLWVLVVTKSCDIGAYFTGKAIGRHKLIPWLSPGKTWEGLAGGMVLAAVVAVLGEMWLRTHSDVRLPGPLLAAVAGLLFAVVGQAGDLLASMLKRDAGIKDASRTVPGFGGVLDLIDSPLLVLPLAFWWLRATTLVG